MALICFTQFVSRLAGLFFLILPEKYQEKNGKQ